MLDFLIWCVYLQVFIAISIILGDGLYNLVKIFFIIAREFCNAQSKQRNLPVQSLEGNLLLLSCHVSYNVFTSYCEMSFCLESITWVISCSVLQKVYLFFTCAYCVLFLSAYHLPRLFVQCLSHGSFFFRALSHGSFCRWWELWAITGWETTNWSVPQR